jgi:hypothetical protein
MEMNMQEIHASIRVELPEDPGLSSVRHVLVAQAWAEMIAKLHDLDGVECALTINEGRKPRQTRKPRAPRLVMPPQDAA